MTGIPNPAAIIRALRKVDANGWTEDLEVAISRAVPHRSDLERHPHATMPVEHFAALAHKLLGGSPAEWKQAACEAILPETYLGTALDIIDEFEHRCDEAEVAASASTKLARERGRRR